MSLDGENEKIARAFLKARTENLPLDRYPGPPPLSLAQAYRVQDIALALDGRAVGGWKVGRIAPGLVDHYGSDRLAGPIFREEIRAAEAGDEPVMPVYAGGFAAAEAELLLRLGDVGSDDHDLKSVRACITEARVGIEIASSPFPGINDHGPAVTVSDYGNNKGLILGPAIPDWREIDLIAMPVECLIDGVRVGAGSMATMLDGPFGAVSFLIRTLRARGIAIAPGTWVSAGAITGVHPIRPGQRCEAVFDGRFRVACSVAAL